MNDAHPMNDPSTDPARPEPAALATAYRFRSAAPHYLSGRPAYSPRLVSRAALLCGLERADRVLDLGCGPAPLGVAFAPLVGEVVAIDPEPAMLRAAAQNAARAGVALRLIEGSSDDLRPDLGVFRLVAIGRAFHWMDRARVLEQLDALVERGGGIALFGTHHPEIPDNGWVQSYRELLRHYAVDDAARARRSAPDWRSDLTVLLDSTFPELERISVLERRSTCVDALVERAFSMSSTAPGRLGGDRADELARAVREFAMRHAANGRLVEVIESEALIARRTGTPFAGLRSGSRGAISWR